MKRVLPYLIVAVSLFFLGRYTAPVRTEVKTVEVVKEVKVQDRTEHKVITEKPDGTKVTEIRTDERTETNINRKIQSSETVDSLKPQWSVGAYRSADATYLLTVDRRIVGNLFIGVYGRTQDLTDNEVGIGLRFEF